MIGSLRTAWCTPGVSDGGRIMIRRYWLSWILTTGVLSALSMGAQPALAETDFCWRPTITRGAGSPLGCAPSEVYDAGLCYSPCPSAGYRGIGPLCHRDCPDGYRDDVFHCAKSAYSRGVGTPMPCGHREQQAGLCYDRCLDSYTGVGPVCWQHCPEGFSDIGVSCRKPHEVRGVGKPVHTCQPDQDQDAGLCYPRCGNGYVGVGPVCWRSCPQEFPINCGAACAKSMEACQSKTGQMVWTSTKAIVDLITQQWKEAVNGGLEAGKSFNMPLCRYPEAGAIIAAQRVIGIPARPRLDLVPPPPIE